MPKLDSNRIGRQERDQKRNNRMAGPGRRWETRVNAEEETRLRKLERQEKAK